MLTQLALPLLTMLAIVAATSIAHAMRSLQTRRQFDIVERGDSCKGVVVGVQRPFLLDSCTRLYFEFAPPGASTPVRCCHIHRHAAHERALALPTTGSEVTVRYLPEQPAYAVIGQLV